MVDCCSPLEVISHLTGRNALDVDINQSNRYCILLNSKTGKEAFYFSTPIYNNLSGKIVNRNFSKINGYYQMIGSNCIVQITNSKLLLLKEQAYVKLNFNRNIIWTLKDGILVSDLITIVPTYNGIVMRGNIIRTSFDIKFDLAYKSVRNSENCVCLMESNFRPIFVISALNAHTHNKGCYPLLVRFNKVSQSSGNIEFHSPNAITACGAVEMSFYEPKIIQDTPVSAKRPRENNAFGPIGFIGKSDFYGLQWLYSRLDINKMPELQNKLIQEIKLYIPRINREATVLDMYELQHRFCSFGSNWDNKVQIRDKRRTVAPKEDYFCFDITDLYTNRGRLCESAGMVIAPTHNAVCNYQMISTGDSYSAPPILYVKYKNI